MKTPLKTLAGLTLAVAAWMKLSEDLPVDDLIPVTPPELPDVPDRFTECPEGQERKLIGGQWRCWPTERPGGR